MFTGIIEEMGRVRATPTGGLEIEAHTVLADAHLGDSIAINGACLTITAFGDGWFRVDTVPETMRRTNLGDLTPGDPVNLERALAAGARMGGHFVQGHVEATASVTSVEQDGEALLIRFKAPESVMRYIVGKGFVTVDGISLTVVSRDTHAFVITLIPYTQTHTNLGQRRPRDRVNIETDILAKYVEILTKGSRQ